MGETLVHAMKIAFVVAIAGAFMIVISNLLSLITAFIFGNIFGEFFGLISMFLPFNASSVFGSMMTAISGIGSFMLGRKIYELTSSRVQL